MTTVFRVSSIAEERLRDVIFKNVQCLRSSIQILDSNLKTTGGEIIDFFCCNNSNDAIIINIDVEQNDDSVLSALSQAQWITENRDLIKIAFREKRVDFHFPPKIILVSSGFSAKTRSAVRQLSRHDITLIQYRYVTAENQDGILFETVLCTEDQTERVGDVNERSSEREGVAEEKSLVTQREEESSRPAESVWVPLTREEEAEFLDSDVDTP